MSLNLADAVSLPYYVKFFNMLYNFMALGQQPSLPNDDVLPIFIALKNPSVWLRLNPMASMLTIP
jgi:hypothetical protein